jgi:rhodanese-related sulfurtransferase
MIGIVTPSELDVLLTTQRVDMIDVRNPDEWDTGHIPGTRYDDRVRVREGRA